MKRLLFVFLLVPILCGCYREIKGEKPGETPSTVSPVAPPLLPVSPMPPPVIPVLWKPLPKMIEVRYSFATEIVNGRIYAMGGLCFGNGLRMLSSCEVLDPESKTWTQLGNMQVARSDFDSVLIGSRIYVMGGVYRDEFRGDVFLSSCEVFDTNTGTWECLPDMNEARAAFRAVALNGKIYVMGGCNNLSEDLSSCEVFDPATGSWTMLASMNQARILFESVVLDGNIYVLGGRTDRGSYSDALSTCEVYDTNSNTWQALPEMRRPHDTFQAVVLNNRIYALGGHSPYCEFFDPEDRSWTLISSMTQARRFFQAVVLKNKIYAFGGDSTNGFVSTAEVFDPTANQWFRLTEMSAPQGQFRVEVLRNSIYVIGGRACEYCEPPK
ncbi:MAG TPA: kelch repeat-containing protein [bacterium]|nr:kelch repeat-containing protein [bacterium]